MARRGRAWRGGLATRRGGVGAIDETTRRVRIVPLECVFGIVVEVTKEARTSCCCDKRRLCKKMDGLGSRIRTLNVVRQQKKPRTDLVSNHHLRFELRRRRVGLRNSIEKRGAGSPCGSLFSTVDDEFVPEIQAVYARAA